MTDVRRLKIESTDANLEINRYENDVVMIMIGTFVTKATERNQIELIRLVAEDETRADLHMMRIDGLTIGLDRSQIGTVAAFLELGVVEEC